MDLIKYISGETKILGIIGNPIVQTKSPFLHNTLSKILKLDYAYVPFLVENEDLSNAITGIKALSILGINVTVPYKEKVLEYLDEISDKARLIGAVNTIKNNKNKLVGYNTDGDGFIKSFIKEFDTDFTNKNITIIGAGGTAKSIAISISDYNVKSIYIVNRTVEKARVIAEMINKHKNSEICKVVETNCIKNISSDIIINTTSLGMFPQENEIPVQPENIFKRGQFVYDIIYKPSETLFLKKAKEFGCITANGIGMLFYQGVKAFEIWTGEDLSNRNLDEFYNEFINCSK